MSLSESGRAVLSRHPILLHSILRIQCSVFYSFFYQVSTKFSYLDYIFCGVEVWFDHPMTATVPEATRVLSWLYALDRGNADTLSQVRKVESFALWAFGCVHCSLNFDQFPFPGSLPWLDAATAKSHHNDSACQMLISVFVFMLTESFRCGLVVASI